jgi:hypothetical protein
VRELSLHILDVLENSLEAGATRIDLTITEDSASNRLIINIQDNGRGMPEDVLCRVVNPFFTTRTTRHVGLGIPLFKAAAQRCNGDLTITSQVGVGTRVQAVFELNHVDRAPLGDIKSTLLGVILSDRGSDLHYRHQVDERVFEFDTAEMRELLGDVPLTHPQVRDWLDEFLTEGFAEMYRG